MTQTSGRISTKKVVGDGDKTVQEVAHELKTAIASGTFKPGQRLVELQLCDDFGVTRSKVREALRRLEHDGLVEITRNVGAMVIEISRNDVEQIYDLLSVLDGLAARVAAPYITSQRLESLENLLLKMGATDKPTLFAALNHEFHLLLCSYSENSRLIKVAADLRLSIRVCGFASFFVPDHIAASKVEHRSIAQALKEGEPAKAEMMVRKHYMDSKIRLIERTYGSL
jgi:DNA-binding GntR family transcriptional regulator